MVQPKFVDLSLSAINHDVAGDLKLKASVILSPSPADGEQKLECRIQDNVIGLVCDTDCVAALKFLRQEDTGTAVRWPIDASVRTIKRDASSQRVSNIQIRIKGTPGSSKDVQQPLDPLLVSPELEDLVKDGRMVSIDQYTALAQDVHVQQMLQQPDMQQALASIDSAPSRETELSKALQNPQFSDLCERILDHVSPQG